MGVGQTGQDLQGDVQNGLAESGRSAPRAPGNRAQIRTRTYSMTMNSRSSEVTRSKVRTMFWWSRVAEILASRRKIAELGPAGEFR